MKEMARSSGSRKMSTFYLLFSGMAVLLLASWPGLVVSSRPTADDSVKAGNHEAVKKDFLNWVLPPYFNMAPGPFLMPFAFGNLPFRNQI
jgi:hypothetical protein